MPTTDEKQTGFEGWVILELMGHRRLAGFLSEQAIGGASFLRIDVPAPDGKGNTATQFYTGSAVYCITPVTEELARKVAANAQPAPVTQWHCRRRGRAVTSSSQRTTNETERQRRCQAPRDVSPLVGRPLLVKSVHKKAVTRRYYIPHGRAGCCTPH
jgi:hypothetical protein